MKLENQVCTIEQGQKLKDLGITAQPFFSWYRGARLSKKMIQGEVVETITDAIGATVDIWKSAKEFNDLNDIFPAYTVAELIQANGMFVFSRAADDEDDDNFIEEYDTTGLSISLVQRTLCMHEAKSVAEGLANLLIHRLFWKETSVEEINQRLADATR